VFKPFTKAVMSKPDFPRLSEEDRSADTGGGIRTNRLSAHAIRYGVTDERLASRLEAADRIFRCNPYRKKGSSVAK
jgi:hypothetical protein